MGKKRKYPEAFRRMAVERMMNCANICALADELGVHRTVLYHWYRQARQAADETATVTSPVRELRKHVGRLSKLLADKTLEVDFFKGALQKVEARRQSKGDSGETASTTRSGK